MCTFKNDWVVKSKPFPCYVWGNLRWCTGLDFFHSSACYFYYMLLFSILCPLHQEQKINSFLCITQNKFTGVAFMSPILLWITWPDLSTSNEALKTHLIYRISSGKSRLYLSTTATAKSVTQEMIQIVRGCFFLIRRNGKVHKGQLAYDL